MSEVLHLLLSSLPGRRKPERAARDLCEKVFAPVLNSTVTKQPVTLTVYSKNPFLARISHFANNKVSIPLLLNNGKYLYFEHNLCLVRTQRHLATHSHRYQYQQTEDHTSWVFRYEYEREPAAGYPYPKYHVHINAQPSGYEGPEPLSDLHFPTERVTIEMVAQFLVQQFKVQPNSSNWEHILEKTEGIFRKIQRQRFAGYAES